MTTVSWSAPSNIALVKYWGKKAGVQIPTNPSVSLTLHHCMTTTRISLNSKNDNAPIVFLLEGEEKPSFLPKIKTLLSHVADDFSFLRDFSVTIESHNTFPHSSGIASSASGMAALALGLTSLEEKVAGTSQRESDAFLQRASFLARLGSGSAARSLYGGAVSWGQWQGVGSDKFASPVIIHEELKTLKNRILIIDGGAKEVSSTLGHGLMKGHSFASNRSEQALVNWQTANGLLADGDWPRLGQLTEQEALSLHAMMMTSDPSFILMKPNTLVAIDKIRKFRAEANIHIYFTLDAGPNIHMLYLEKDEALVHDFCSRELISLCEEGRFIQDRVGMGPKQNEA